jgi:hypothetical protein
MSRIFGTRSRSALATLSAVGLGIDWRSIRRKTLAGLNRMSESRVV